MDAVTHAFAAVPTDWLVIVCAAIIVAGSAMLRGSSYGSALAISFPLAFVVSNSVSTAAVFGTIARQFSSSIEQAILFAIIFAVLYVCSYMMLSSYENSTGPLSGIIVGAAATIVVVVVWIQVPALQSLWHFGAQVQNIFGSSYRFWWLIGSYILLAFARS